MKNYEIYNYLFSYIIFKSSYDGLYKSFYEMSKHSDSSGSDTDLSIVIENAPELLIKPALKAGKMWNISLTSDESLELSNKYVSDELDEWWSYPY